MAQWEDIVKNVDSNEVNFEITKEVYPEDVILKASYIFIDSCFVFIEGFKENKYLIHMRVKNEKLDAQQIAGEFFNELLNQKLQNKVNQETGRIRELLTAQAFSDVKIVQEDKKLESYKDDPLNISELKGT